MPWTCKLVEIDERKYEVGEMYYGKAWDESTMSEHYNREWKDKRPPLYVRTPAGVWCIDQKPITNGVWQNGGWVVTGEAPNVTASPSINITGYYHGWLQNGILSDDVEGRRFE